ncbi:hypothetical protein [Streptomyces sp. NBC_00425]|uniref:hypothetical protein n=1 Tax=Streptomyces sp. NBC_00425 TaxID=2975740 RepID=UPI002E246F3F
MAQKQFALRTEPHVAQIGADLELRFTAEVYGDEFLDAYAELQEAQAALGAADGDMSKLTGDKLRVLYTAIRTFLFKMMTEESADRFQRFEVHQGDAVEVFRDRAEADLYAGRLEGAARVVDKSVRLPDRVLIELMEWSVELYGGGGETRPTGPSKGSSAGSRRTGTRGKAPSRSKV